MKKKDFIKQKKNFLGDFSTSIDFEKMASEIDQEFELKNENEVKKNFAHKNFKSFNYLNNLDSALSQSRCGGCWAFVAAASMEGNYNKKFNRSFDNLLQLSPQQIIDCDLIGGEGC
jgi:hypothetical protein